MTKTVSDEAYKLLQGIADMTLYGGEEPDLDDALETANWCISRAREVLGLPARNPNGTEDENRFDN